MDDIKKKLFNNYQKYLEAAGENMTTEITVEDILKARLAAAMDCLNLNDFKGCKYSLIMAIKVIDENTPQTCASK